MKFFSFNKNKWLFGFAALFFFGNTMAQTLTSSPYSRYAFGDLMGNPHSSFYGLGNTGTAYCDSNQVNSLNPASYSFLLANHPTFDIGVSGQILQLKTQTDSRKQYAFNLRGISLGMKMTKRWGLAFGITPYSTVGYNFTNRVDEPGIGSVTYKYDGTGGINRLFLGTSCMIFRDSLQKISIGANMNYLFGSLNSTSKAIINGNNPSSGVLHTKVNNNTFVSDFTAEAGLLYRRVLGKSKNTWLTLGATYNLSNDLYAQRTSLAYNFADSITESLVDTVFYKESGVGRIHLPEKLSFAFSLEKKYGTNAAKNEGKRFIFSAQYDIQKWGLYNEVFDGDTAIDNMNDTRTFNVSFSYQPYSSALIGPEKKWNQLSTYRIGFTKGTTYLNLNDTRFDQYGISFGIGVPLIHSASFSQFNLGVELGRRNTSDGSLINEEYINLNIGVTISSHKSDPWFFKRKYD